MKKKCMSFLMLTGSTLIIAIGVYFFKFSNNFNFGGVTGIAVLLAQILPFSASDLNFWISMALLILGFVFLGRDFGAKTAYCSILLSVSLSALERIYPMVHPLTDQPMLELVFAIILPAIGSGILFNIGASSGGTDIIAMILKKFTSINIGRALLFTNLIITVVGCFMFDIKTVLYSFLGLAISSLMIDNVIESINMCKYFNVVCTNPVPIQDFITGELHRSATTCNAKGAFSGKDKFIIFTAMNRTQAIKLRNFIKEQEPSAFILISNTSEIIGKGFHVI
ncbi:YitT family protein [Lachnospiraceae bacterium LCP25S3_G4]